MPDVPAQTLKEFLERALSGVEEREGRFAQVAGLRYTFDPSQPAQELAEDGTVATPGQRVRELALNDGRVLVQNGRLVAQTLEPGYDIEGEQVSALAAETADNPWIVTLGLLAWAAGTAACGETLRRALPRRRLWWTAVAALWVAAAGMGAAAALPLDCSPAAGSQCLRRAEAGELSWRHEGHGAAAGLILLAVALSPFALWLALRPGRGARIALACGVIGLVAFQLVEGAVDLDPGDRGGGQRILLLTTVLWLCALAVLSWRAARGRTRGPGSHPDYKPSSPG